MLDRLQKPFLTVETGEAYQPIRLTYELLKKDSVVAAIEKLKCIQKNPTQNSWTWYWKAECDDLHFESLDTYKKNPEHPLRLATLTLRGEYLHINLSSFKRACLAVSFFYEQFAKEVFRVKKADFINKVFGLEERLPHGLSEIFRDDELDHIIEERKTNYAQVQERCEQAATAEEALQILADYANQEGRKRLPYAERYVFRLNEAEDSEILFLGFYIFLRSRELVAIKRWFGETGYSLADAADETIEQVFGDMGIDIIE